jgi:hypothetical protein
VYVPQAAHFFIRLIFLPGWRVLRANGLYKARILWPTGKGGQEQAAGTICGAAWLNNPLQAPSFSPLRKRGTFLPYGKKLTPSGMGVGS